jgi:hypothetical protein
VVVKVFDRILEDSSGVKGPVVLTETPSHVRYLTAPRPVVYKIKINIKLSVVNNNSSKAK